MRRKYASSALKELTFLLSLIRWLLVDLPRARYYEGVLQQKAIEEMKMAMMVEDEPSSVAAYFAFLKMQVEEMLANLPLQQSYQLISSIAVSTATLIYQR